MPIIIMFRSLTFAQRGARELERFGISAAVTKAPVHTSEHGCSYCIRISETRLKSAISILSDRGIAYGRLFRVEADGRYVEVMA